MGFISNQLEGAFRAGAAHKELASQLFSYCRDNKDSIGSEGYWQMFTMPNADLGELAKSIKYLPKKNGNYCVELADVNFYFKTESDAGPLLPPTIYVMKETTGALGGGMSSSSFDSDFTNLFEEDEATKERRSAGARKAAQTRKEAEERARAKVSEIASLPMPEPTEIVVKIQECKLYAKNVNESEKGKNAKLISDAWMARYQLLIEYGKIHCADDPAFMQLLADEEAEQKRKAEIEAQQKAEKEAERRAQKERQKQRIEVYNKHKKMFWVIWGVVALITCVLPNPLTIIALIVAPIVRFFVTDKPVDIEDEYNII